MLPHVHAGDVSMREPAMAESCHMEWSNAATYPLIDASTGRGLCLPEAITCRS